MSRRQAALCLAAGLALLAAAPVAWAGLTPDPAGQTVIEVNAAAAAALAAPPDRQLPSVQPLPSVPAPDPAAAAQPAAPVAAAVGEPVRVRLPSLGIDSPVVPVGVTGSGDLEIPGDVDDVGWYRFGPAPGAGSGSAVLTGHVDSVRQGPGPFSRLGELAPGDIVAVVDEAGVERSFTVLSREEWAKSEVPMDRLFDRGGSARLVLITCGGDFDAASGHYEDNVAVTAVPTPGSPG
jgi:hypothetical protein